jgi:hypothetical protein
MAYINQITSGKYLIDHTCNIIEFVTSKTTKMPDALEFRGQTFNIANSPKSQHVRYHGTGKALGWGIVVSKQVGSY